MTELHKAQRQIRNYSAAEKSEEITGRLSQSMKIIPEYLSSMNWCQNTVNSLSYCGSVIKWTLLEVFNANITIFAETLGKCYSTLEISRAGLDVDCKNSLAS